MGPLSAAGSCKPIGYNSLRSIPLFTSFSLSPYSSSCPRQRESFYPGLRSKQRLPSRAGICRATRKPTT
ncbi:unknown protein [Desulfotalea psychrophila LSv54]|uniref:Uncharacterized protein n=1 Tax=Desulfotalea psychrophila (strain LSv54 / DSM 12343) TaxID=177439 RepID=Q6AMZ0_DESPS|nr:unknown protein [Desulfotalea psychrophila LSv54]